MATVDPPFSELLAAWVARQRWYTGKGTEPRLERTGGLRLQAPAGEVGIETHLVLDRGGRSPVLYQVPLTYRRAPLEGHEEALVAVTDHSDLGRRWVYDACHDPVGAAALLRAVTDELELAADGPPGNGRARGHRTGLLPALAVRGSRVLRGEQSNTSVIFDTVDPDDGEERPVILKVFRVLHPGRNPDVEVQQALALAGSTRVPRPVGDLLGQWPAPDGGTQLTGHLALAQEFLPGAPDAWRVTLGALERGEDLAPRARALGEATAEVHATLAAVLPTAEPDDAARAAALAGWRARYETACEHVPDLARRADRVGEVLEAGAAAWWPPLQRIHGDYHLGQVLDVPGRGWVLLDFEGEPLRPLAERTLPDLPQRDVAGMLRSFDYAAASVPAAGGEVAAGRAREAFLDGYAHISRNDPRDEPALLHALELDKALYEVTYEARNRPDWLPIPLSGVARILGA
ncbi:aminoglycoside phosphotransferase [Georgenia sp. EYE_87]|uniref:maltokinase N-terminal cap-like domain-containing protein n=1 Tax=Georgenia sp. EYE_87 TaxID=2853448 RepID=UPI002006CAF6|nr:aminoglycoside phosphotransferase [Georgenia sp. EYE_87]